MTASQHGSLTAERWAGFTLDQQILMIANELHRLVDPGKIPAADVAAYELVPGEAGTTVNRLELDTGGLIKGWVPSFAAVEREGVKGWYRKLAGADEPEPDA